MFDPEKVERFTAINAGDLKACVLASDYDQLLERYRKAEASREAYAKGLMTMRQPAEV